MQERIMADIRDLAALIARHAPVDGVHPTALPRVFLIRSSTPTEPIPTLYRPALCIVAQGRKQAMLGTTAFVYDPAKFLVVALDLPVTGSVIEASAEQPYLCLQLDLDLPALGDLFLAQGGNSLGDPGEAGPGLALTEATPGLVDAAVRLLQLLDEPADAVALAPLVEREIMYRLMTGEQASLVRRVTTAGSHLHQISRSIAWIRQNYAMTFGNERLADIAGMSQSSFYEHFRTMTAMTPLQYRNQLRLQEARRLMVADALDAAAAGFRVGYDSPSQFSRDYARIYGTPPARDAARLRAAHELQATG